MILDMIVALLALAAVILLLAVRTPLTPPISHDLPDAP